MPNDDIMTYIDLDDPTPAWHYWVAVVAVIVAIIVVMTPFVALPGETAEANFYDGSRVTTLPPISPNADSDICAFQFAYPAILRPAVNVAAPSWARMCEWFRPFENRPPARTPDIPPTP